MFGNNYTNPYGYNSAPFGYNPNAIYPNYNTVQNTTAQTPATNTNKIFVSGIEDVRARSLSANSDYMFLDNDKPILYQKVVDSKGQFEVKVFDIVPHKEESANTSVDMSQYISRSEFDKLSAELNALKEQLNKLGGNSHESVEQQ